MKKYLFLSFIFVLAFSISLLAGTADLNSPNNSSADGSSGHHGLTEMERNGLTLGSRQTVVDSVPAPGGSSHMGLGWDGTYLWHVTNNVPINAFQFDTISGTLISQITTSIGTYVLGCTYLNGSLWIQEWSTSGTTYEVDPNTGSTISSFTSPAGTGSRGLTNDGTDLWIFGTGGSTNSGTAYQVSTTGSTIHTCTIGNVIQWPMGASYDNQRGTFFVNDNSTANDINELDLSGAAAVLVSEFAHPDAGNGPEGITYDGQYLWTVGFYGTWVFKIDIGDPPPAPPEAILYVDDDEGGVTETFWETSFNNFPYPYDKWVVFDSAGVSPDQAAMSAYTIVVWSTGGDYSNTLTGAEVTEIGNWLNAGGKLWFSSQDVLYDYGSASWMHISGWSDDVGCTNATGIDIVMSPLSFPTGGGAFTDFADILTPDGTSWTSMINETNDTNTVAMDTTVGLPYFLYFNAFGWENITAEADRDSMMKRVLMWMNYMPPAVDVGTQAIVWPPTSVVVGLTGNPSATYHNYGATPATFDVHFEIDSSGVNVYTGTVGNLYLDAAASSTWVFPATWTPGLSEGITYDVTAYTVMTGDMNPSNDTLTQVTTTTTVSDWIQCADRPTPQLCQATTYDPVGDKVYTFGGGDGTVYVNFTYQYDPVTDAWAALTPIPTAINWIDASVTEWNRSIYIFGGYNGGFNTFNYIYDINGDSWSSGAPVPAARIASGQCVYNDSLIYLICGYTGSAGSNTVYIYNTYTNAWTTGTNAPTTSYMQAVATTGDTLWLVMSYNGSSCNPNMYYGIPDPANCENISWNTGPALPAPNFNGGGTAMYRPSGTFIFEVGGFENATVLTNHAWEYDVSNATWNALPNYPMTIARNDILTYRRTATEAEIYVNGGDNSGAWTPTAQTWKLQWNVGVEEEKPTKTALTFGLGKVSPNPIRNGSIIAYTTTQKGYVSLKVYNSAGRLVRTLVDRNENPGQKTVTWNGLDNNHNAVAAGVYFYRLSAENRTTSKKMVVIK